MTERRDGEKEKSSRESETEEKNPPLLKSTTTWSCFHHGLLLGRHQLYTSVLTNRPSPYIALQAVGFFFFHFFIFKPYHQQESIEKLNILKISLKLLHRLVKQQSHNPK